MKLIWAMNDCIRVLNEAIVSPDQQTLRSATHDRSVLPESAGLSEKLVDPVGNLLTEKLRFTFVEYEN